MHHSYLDDLLESGEVVDSRLSYVDEMDKYLIVGRLVCRHGLFLDVEKKLRVNDRGLARTRWSSYHAGVSGQRNRPIFRYDNALVYALEGHPDAHHRHRFDHVTWQEIEPPEWVGHDRWPHLDEVVRELMAWWGTSGRHLDLSESSP